MTGKTSTDDDNGPSVSERFDSLSTGAKAGIAGGSAAAALGVVACAIFMCVRKRKQGAEEAALAAKRMEDERFEYEGYKAAGINPDGFSESAPTYDAKTGMATMVSDDYAGAQNEKLGAQPLLRNEGSYSPPGTPNAHESSYANPYSDGFSPVDDNGHVYDSMHAPLPGPLPGAPGAQQGYYR